MHKPKELNFDEAAELYLDSQEGNKAELKANLEQKQLRFKPDGFMLLRCIMMDSSRRGERVIIPYGGTATYKTVPTQPISPRGLASDMSEVEAIFQLK